MTTGANGGRSLRRVALLLLLLPAAVAASPTPAGDPIVIVLSWDGVRHDYLDRADFPALKRIEREGLRADRLIPVFPSSTFPNHVSMVTGTYADRHGIVGNRFLDPAYDWFGERKADDESDDQTDERTKKGATQFIQVFAERHGRFSEQIIVFLFRHGTLSAGQRVR